MNTLTFKVISEVTEAKKYWEIFSPKKTIDDEWDFRQAFGKELNLPLHFILGFDGDTEIGLLPLQLNTLKGLDPKYLNMTVPFLEFFGGIDTDNNRILLKKDYEEYAPEFLKQISKPAVLTDLSEQYSYNETIAEHSTDRFELDLTELQSAEDFVNKNFSGKSKGKLLNKIRYMYKNFKIEIKDGDKDDLNLLFKFSIDKFAENSSFNMQYRQNIYKYLMDIYKVDLFTISVNGEKKGIAYCIIHNGVYTLLNVGYDHDLRDIGKVLVSAQIDRAINNKCKKYDAGKGDNGWKERYHLSKIPQYKLTLNL